METINDIVVRYATNIKTIFSDVDGVLTPKALVTIFDVRNEERTVVFTEEEDDIRFVRLVVCDDKGQPLSSHEEIRYIAGQSKYPILEGYTFNTHDGQKILWAVEEGFLFYFISGRNSPCVKKRASDLKAIALLGEKDKLQTLKNMDVDLSTVLFFGDGEQDAPAMRAIREAGGLTVAPNDAQPAAIQEAAYVTRAKGGGGVIVEVLDPLLKYRKQKRCSFPVDFN